MKKYTLKELRNNFKDMYVILSIVERDERGFAKLYKLLGVAKSKREIEKMFPDIKAKNPDCYINETFLNSRNCFRFRMIDNKLTKLSAFSPSECAEVFRQYYNIQR